MDYFDVYSKLYENGYRDKLKFTGSRFAMALTAVLKYKSILDVGCARGEGLRWFTYMHKRAIGVDVARDAVSDACRRGSDARLASACDLPFGGNSFDLVFSSDVVEHLENDEDVAKAIVEMIRVSSHYIALQIAIHPTKHAWTHVVDIPNIHMVVWSVDTWREYFSKRADVHLKFFGIIKHHVLVVLEKVHA